MASLFDPVQMGDLALPNRIVMAPLTRNRAVAGLIIALHQSFSGCWMVNNGYDRADAEQALSSGKADLVAFGRPFICNPDLVRRLREAAPLTPLQEDKLYGGV